MWVGLAVALTLCRRYGEYSLKHSELAKKTISQRRREGARAKGNSIYGREPDLMLYLLLFRFEAYGPQTYPTPQGGGKA